MPQRSSRRVGRVAVALLVVASSAALLSCGRDDRTRPPGKIGFIFVGQRDDLGYNQAAWEGSEALARAFPAHEVLREPGVPESERAEEVMEAQIRAGATLLFATSFGHLSAAYAVARRHPEVIVLHQGGIEPTPRLDNFGTYWGSIYETVYQAGIVAGAATETGHLGFVAAFPIPATFDNVNAFALGARSVRPGAVTHVRFTGSWCDPTAQQSAARSLLAIDADVLTQHQDCTRSVLQAAEQAGVSAVGYHSDGSEVAPNAWLVGAVWRWAPLFAAATEAAFGGDFAGSSFNGDYRGGLSTGVNPLILTELSPAVAPDIAALVDAAGTAFAGGRSPFAGPLRDRDGRLRVPAGRTLTAREIDAIDWFVDGVEGALPA